MFIRSCGRGQEDERNEKEGEGQIDMSRSDIQMKEYTCTPQIWKVLKCEREEKEEEEEEEEEPTLKCCSMNSKYSVRGRGEV